jgi:hypothetical protein
MPSTRPDPITACVLNLDQVDAVQGAAHRLVLFQTLIANTLEDYCEAHDDLEALMELAQISLNEARTINTVIHRGCRVAGKAAA